eukprot:CAMPEP_0169474338 /NCGR_PEP_ID=MMETSP1042-20121227/26204_1 /TAXON_ID=464988 /ORGANISM="Hemiselmis andersenii, Strain CCMP1180" /LENGTH=378 /DNA_ID=CAMNT_0009588363 /DNA_START=27 /DNA_END=1160 /DNA_ORIENTATION=-
MAAVAAAARNARLRRGKSLREREDDHISSNLDRTALLHRMRQVEAILEETRNTRLFGLDEAGGGEGAEVDDETMLRQVTGLLSQVRERLDRSTSYRRFAGSFAFFLLYVTVIFLQRDILKAFSVEDSLLNALKGSLPNVNVDGYTNADRGATGVLNDAEEFYEWFGVNVLNRVYVDEVCGDGLCESPNEYTGFGRFGCLKDCGRYDNTTRIYVNLQDWVADTSSSWNILNTDPILQRENPYFKWNIWSETMQGFMLEEDSNQTSLSIDVPDGHFELRLYQTISLAKTIGDVSDVFKVSDEATLPSRSSGISDFFYGDKAEVLAVAASNLLAVDEYCVVDANGMKDPYCTDEYSMTDFEIKTLGGYGLTGGITFKNGSS